MVLDLVVCPDLHFSLAHDLASHIEDDIVSQVPGATAMIHIEGPDGEHRLVSAIPDVQELEAAGAVRRV